MANTKDMTHGNPTRLLIAFALPLICGTLFQQLYNMVDSIIVGKFLGVDALAAVGCCGSLNFLIIGFCNGTGSGMTIPIAQRFGAQDVPNLRRYVANCIYLGAFMAVVITLVTALNCRRILGWMNTPENIIEDANRYFTVILLGIPATVLYNVAASIMRALGDSRRPLYFLIFSSVLNIVLDLLLIVVCKTGVMGAAIATVISQLIAGILCVVYMVRSLPILHVQGEQWKPSTAHMKHLAGVGVPMGLQFSITAVGSVILSSAVNSLGSIAVASMTAAGKIAMLFNMAHDSMGSAMATYSGQNLGAKKLDRIGQGMKSALVIMCSYAVLTIFVMVFFGRALSLLFVDGSETDILSNVHFYLIVNSATSFLLAFVNIVRLTIQGLGFSNFALFAGVFEMIARTLVAFILVPAFGFRGACFANAAAWLAADLFLVPGYFRVMRRLRKAEAMQEKAASV
ncbi:MAG: MATE family efflux transporter [Clostridia bacterium]|nr:MATE family efflux transporter [Clostridia bacterium]